ncbi:MAG: guanosine polyphosphate pyrophosphohydrolase [Lachnospiraceae bacterium]
MVKLNDYLYSGDTVLKILRNYSRDLKESARQTHNHLDMVHSNFLLEVLELLEHNEFLTAQSQKIREFYYYMAAKYPYLAFTFKGRIKSLIRIEEKFNGYVVEYISEYHKRTGGYPKVSDVIAQVQRFHDIIAYRIILAIPKCHVSSEEERGKREIRILYEIANVLPEFLEERGFTPQLTGIEQDEKSPLLDDFVKPYFRDYVTNVKDYGYRSLHITFYDNSARSFIEMQLRTKDMDDEAEIGMANHKLYELKQEFERGRRESVPQGESLYFDEAYERIKSLQDLDLSQVDVCMFKAVDNHLMNDGCGLFRGRLITPFEHLSRFQNDSGPDLSPVGQPERG